MVGRSWYSWRQEGREYGRYQRRKRGKVGIRQREAGVDMYSAGCVEAFWVG
jgi:hypothetical protein